MSSPSHKGIDCSISTDRTEAKRRRHGGTALAQPQWISLSIAEPLSACSRPSSRGRHQSCQTRWAQWVRPSTTHTVTLVSSRRWMAGGGHPCNNSQYFVPPLQSPSLANGCHLQRLGSETTVSAACFIQDGVCRQLLPVPSASRACISASIARRKYPGETGGRYRIGHIEGHRRQEIGRHLTSGDAISDAGGPLCWRPALKDYLIPLLLQTGLVQTSLSSSSVIDSDPC